jgi:hypothetical protein
MKRLTFLVQAAVVGALLGVGSMSAIAATGPGECGEYKYWHNHHCVDARMAPSSVPWTKSVF